MYAGWPVPFLYGQAMQHFERCQVAVAPDSVADTITRKTVPNRHIQPNNSFRLVSMVWVFTSS